MSQGPQSPGSHTLQFTGDEIGDLLKALPGDGVGGPIAQVRQKLNSAAGQSNGAAVTHVPVTHDEVKALNDLTSAAVTGPLAQLRVQCATYDVAGGPGGGPIGQGHGILADGSGSIVT